MAGGIVGFYDGSTSKDGKRITLGRLCGQAGGVARSRGHLGSGAVQAFGLRSISVVSQAAADFFTMEVWTWRGLTTYYTLFVIDLASRRVQIVGFTPHPDGLSMANC